MYADNLQQPTRIARIRGFHFDLEGGLKSNVSVKSMLDSYCETSQLIDTIVENGEVHIIRAVAETIGASHLANCVLFFDQIEVLPEYRKQNVTLAVFHEAERLFAG